MCVYLCNLKNKSNWRRLGGGKGKLQNQALADIVSRIDQCPGPPTNQAEDIRTRRRRLYRMASEKKPSFPHQHRNFYAHVMENKEIVKTLSLLSTCTHDLKPVSNKHTKLMNELINLYK